MEARGTQLESENAQLRAQLNALQTKYDALEAETRAKIQALIDENEALADANRLLLENQQTFERLAPTLAGGAAGEPLSQIPDELLLPGEGLQTAQLTAMEDVHTMGNLLSVATPVGRSHIAVTGGVDKHIMVHDWATQRKLCAYAASGPVLDMAFNPVHREFFVATFMDAKHAVLRLVEQDGAWRIEEVATFHDHTRPGAMRVAWSSTGEFFATGSCDKSLHLYRCEFLRDVPPKCEKIKSFYFNGIVEAMAFVPPAADGTQNELLAIAVRDDCYVHYVDCKTFEKERVNMNQDGIEHVSYTIMDLRVSPMSGKYLLAATDKDRHFIFSVKSNVVYRNLYGHKAGPYSQPRVTWHPSEKYVISNTEDSGRLFVWCVASERVVEQIDAHEKLVRGLVVTQPSEAERTPGAKGAAILLTVSYDKRLKAWGARALGSSLLV